MARGDAEKAEHFRELIANQERQHKLLASTLNNLCKLRESTSFVGLDPGTFLQVVGALYLEKASVLWRMGHYQEILDKLEDDDEKG